MLRNLDNSQTRERARNTCVNIPVGETQNNKNKRHSIAKECSSIVVETVFKN